MKKLLALFIVTMLLINVCGCTIVYKDEKTTSTVADMWSVEDEERNKVVVVSDIHLGIVDKYSETVENKNLFIEFLDRLGNMEDVSELVIAGDFLDEWYLPLTYPAYGDSDEFYRQVIKNNQQVFDQLVVLMEKGIKLTYVPGNHDMLLESNILEEALPGINQARDARGLGKYVTGVRDEIVIEHGHRYDVFSAPDSVSNKEITGDVESILPPGYFYARVAASWVLQGHPMIKKDYPEIVQAPAKTDVDQYGAYLYYKVWSGEMNRITPYERFEDHVIDLKLNGYNGKYSIQDYYPILQSDGTICAPTLFKNYQSTWEENQEKNLVAVKTSFVESVAGTLDKDYFYNQAKKQYLENTNQNIDVVVFGHTHKPGVNKLSDTQDKYYANSGSWIDENTFHPDACTFVVVTTNSDSSDKVQLFEYYDDGTVKILE